MFLTLSLGSKPSSLLTSLRVGLNLKNGCIIENDAGKIEQSLIGYARGPQRAGPGPLRTNLSLST